MALNTPAKIETRRFKTGLIILGSLLALPGSLLALGYVCAGFATLAEEGEAFTAAMVLFVLMLITFGAGLTIDWNLWRSQRGLKSKPIRLWPIWRSFGLFALLLVIGAAVDDSIFAGLLFPPTLALLAALPPLAAIAWFAPYITIPYKYVAEPEKRDNTDDAEDTLRQEGDTEVFNNLVSSKDSAKSPEFEADLPTIAPTKTITWRRAVLAFVGGGTLGVFVALILSAILPLILFSLVFGLGQLVFDHLETLLNALAGEQVGATIFGPGFIFAFVQLALVAPIAEELAKPLVTLPLLRHLTKRQAFLMGAMAGAGFAALENMLYAGFGYWFWEGILAVRALGGAIHPLGAGLVALAWRDVLLGEPKAWQKWLARFGLAAGMHALWNGGSLLIVTLAGIQFFGPRPPEINVLGLSAAGTTLALLLILGLAALWIGRAVLQSLDPDQTERESVWEGQFLMSDRAIAIWGLACLLAILPAGISSLQFILP